MKSLSDLIWFTYFPKQLQPGWIQLSSALLCELLVFFFSKPVMFVCSEVERPLLVRRGTTSDFLQQQVGHYTNVPFLHSSLWFQVCASAPTSLRGWPVSAACLVTMETRWLARLVIVSLALVQTAAAVSKLRRRDRWCAPTALQDRQVTWASSKFKKNLWTPVNNGNTSRSKQCFRLTARLICSPRHCAAECHLWLPTHPIWIFNLITAESELTRLWPPIVFLLSHSSNSRPPLSCAGMRCQMCEDGYYGDPLGQSGMVRACVRCNCNGNVDFNAVGICDHFTGRCLKCMGHTEGDHCQRCQRGFYGNALEQTSGQKCKRE